MSSARRELSGRVPCCAASRQTVLESNGLDGLEERDGGTLAIHVDVAVGFEFTDASVSVRENSLLPSSERGNCGIGFISHIEIHQTRVQFSKVCLVEGFIRNDLYISLHEMHHTNKMVQTY